MKNFLSDLKDGGWLLIPVLIIVILFSYNLYYRAHYCFEVPYETVCEDCVQWETKTNGRYGKFKRSWSQCVEWRRYRCVQTYDSCSDTKLKY